MTCLGGLLRHIAADSALALTFKTVSIPLGYLTLIIIARLFGAEQMGTYTIVIYLITILSVVCRLGLDLGLLRFFAALQAEGKDGELLNFFYPAVALILLLSGPAALALYGSGEWLAGHFHAPSLPQVLAWAAPALPLLVVAALCGEGLRALGGVRWVVFSQDLLTPVLVFTLTIVMGYYGQSLIGAPQALGCVFLASSIIALGFLAAVLKSRLPGRLWTWANPAPIKDLLKYSWPLFFSSLCMLVFWSVDSLILGFFKSPENVAYYESAAKTALIINLPLIAVNAAVPHLFARFCQQGDMQRVETVAQATSRWMYYVALPLACVCMLAAPEILGFFGPGFAEADTALRVLAAAHLVNVSCGSVVLILAMTGHQLTLTLAQALAGLIGLPLMSAAAAFYGLTGMAAAKALWLAGVSILMASAVWRHLKIRVFAAHVLHANLGGILGTGFFYLLKGRLGIIGALAGFALGYGLLTCKSVQHEMGVLNSQIPWDTPVTSEAGTPGGAPGNLHLGGAKNQA
ncbi:MAG: oligosaccharide flippase family protein [Deltaproteobacteria bacterium]|nr:oligosaccharide flippase family protein [Deltaproteobacteria bacterium]